MPTLMALTYELSKLPNVSWHIMVADNASTDGTGEVVRTAHIPHTSVLAIPTKGKGIAIRTAAAHAKEADLFGFIDADLSADPASIVHLLEADIAIGSRLLKDAHVKRGALRTLSSRAFNLLRRMLLGINVADSQCGLKIMNQKGVYLLETCKEKKWFLDIELLVRAQKKGLRITEVPIEWDEYHYQDRKSKLLLWRDGLAALSAMMRIKARNL